MCGFVPTPKKRSFVRRESLQGVEAGFEDAAPVLQDLFGLQAQGGSPGMQPPPESAAMAPRWRHIAAQLCSGDERILRQALDAIMELDFASCASFAKQFMEQADGLATFRQLLLQTDDENLLTLLRCFARLALGSQSARSALSKHPFPKLLQRLCLRGLSPVTQEALRIADMAGISELVRPTRVVYSPYPVHAPPAAAAAAAVPMAPSVSPGAVLERESKVSSAAAASSMGARQERPARSLGMRRLPHLHPGPGEISITFHIPHKHAAVVIGKRGTFKQEVIEKAGVRVVWIDSVETDPTLARVEVIGNSTRRLEDAKRMILARVEAFSR